MITESLDTFQTRTRDFSERDRLTAIFGMQHLPGNHLPYFSITGERGVPGSKNPEICGCIHDEIGEQIPDLTPLIKWHLVDQDGEPLHYIANALYWRDCAMGRYPHRRGAPDPVATFAKHVLFGTVATDKGYGGERTAKQVMRLSSLSFQIWLMHRIPALRDAFQADMESFGIEFITMPQTP